MWFSFEKYIIIKNYNHNHYYCQKKLTKMAIKAPRHLSRIEEKKIHNTSQQKTSHLPYNKTNANRTSASVSVVLIDPTSFELTGPKLALDLPMTKPPVDSSQSTIPRFVRSISTAQPPRYSQPHNVSSYSSMITELIPSTSNALFPRGSNHNRTGRAMKTNEEKLVGAPNLSGKKNTRRRLLRKTHSIRDFKVDSLLSNARKGQKMSLQLPTIHLQRHLTKHSPQEHKVSNVSLDFKLQTLAR